MKSLEEIKAKKVLLGYLKTERLITDDVMNAAIARLGSDLCDALSGKLGQTLLVEIGKEKQRLDNRQFRIGDRVKFTWGGAEYEAELTTVAHQSVQVDFKGRRDFGLNEHEITGARISEYAAILEAGIGL